MFTFPSWVQHYLMYHANGKPDSELVRFKKFVQMIGYLVRHDQMDITSIGMSCDDWLYMMEHTTTKHSELYDKVIGPQFDSFAQEHVGGISNRIQQIMSSTIIHHMDMNAEKLDKKKIN